MLQRIKNYALYGDTDENNYLGVKDKIESYNRSISLAFASVAAFLIIIMLILSFFNEGFTGSRPVYILGIVFSGVQILVTIMAKKRPELSYVSVYMGVSVFLLYGIAIATLTRPDQQTVTFMVLLIFVPLIFLDRPIRMAIVLLFYMILFIVMACFTKTGTILSVDITDALIFGFLSIISESIVYRAKIKGFVLEYKLHIMSETDQLTGLKNRNSYEVNLSSYPKKYKKSIICIYIDANGLHEINNIKGHKYGDDMLCFIAESIINQFGNTDTYRIGGDEFVVFAIDIDNQELSRRLSHIEHDISEKGYNAAVGYSFHEGENVDLNNLIKEAESMMYDKKTMYYKTHDRRSR
jgi:diguanylate cyclase (GGDEF)-like protein